jgi:IS30 family transposase
MSENIHPLSEEECMMVAGGMAAFKHLCTDQRVKIQTLLETHTSFNKIAKEIGAHKTTISREIRNFRCEHNVKAMGFSNRCTKRKNCDKHDVCPGHSYLCRNKSCAHCHKE